MISFAVQKFLSLIRSYLLFLHLFHSDPPPKIFLQFMSKSILPVFSSRSFKLSCLAFRSLTSFEFIFVHDVRRCSLLFFKRHDSRLFFWRFIYFVLFLTVVGLRCHMGSLWFWPVELLSSCSVQVSHFRGFSCCKEWALRPMGSVVVVHGLIFPVACRIFLDQGSNSRPLHCKTDS